MIIQLLLNSIWIILMIVIFYILLFDGLFKNVLKVLGYKKNKQNTNKEKDVLQR